MIWKFLTTPYILLTLCATVLCACQTAPKGAKGVKPFDVNRYVGKWYEIARFDSRFEKNLNNVTAEYSLNDDGTIRVKNRGFDYEENEWKEVVGKAKFADDKNEGKLKVSFFGPFYSGYNVIAIDQEYQHALIAGKNLEYLWILSRGKNIPEATKQEYLAKAKSLGYDTSALIWVEHTE